VLARAGDPEGARSAYDRAIARFPGDWRTWVGRALDAPEGERTAAWRDAFAAGAPAGYLPHAWASLPVGLAWLEAGEGRARFSANLGAFLASKGDLEAAALAYEQAFLADPHEPPHAGYVQVLRKLGRLDDAARFVGSALAAHPDDLEMRQQEAEILEARDQWDEAAAAWFRIGAAKPDATARGLRAVEHQQGTAAALAQAERRALAEPLDDGATLERARMARDTGDYASCVAYIDAAGLQNSKRYGARAKTLREACATASTLGLPAPGSTPGSAP
jgi:tetratricopeptide (TPR) repeat protein